MVFLDVTTPDVRDEWEAKGCINNKPFALFLRVERLFIYEPG